MGNACGTICALARGEIPLFEPDGRARGSALPVAQAIPVARAVAVDAAAAAGHALQAQVVRATALPAPAVAAVPVAAACKLPVGSPVLLQSQLTGRKRSLMVGINYVGTSSELSGCINDVKRMRPFLEGYGFATDEQSQMVLCDDGEHKPPTRSNMLSAFQWLTTGVQAGDALFFHYSGHGGRQECSYEEAADGYHETLCPVDYASAGQILDTEMFEILVRPLPSGVKLVCLLDCCHSAGALNLPYLFTGTQENLQNALAGKAIKMAMSRNWAASVAQWQQGNPADLIKDVASMGLGIWSLWQESKQATGANEAGFKAEEAQNTGLAVGEVIAFTGCRSDQTSADVGDVTAQFHIKPIGSAGRGSLVLDPGRNGAAGGALTAVFIESLQAGQHTYLELLERMRQRLAEGGFSQVPQFVSSLLVELQQPFTLDRISIPPRDKAEEAGSGAAPSASSNGVGSFMAGLMGQSSAGSALVQNSRGMGDEAPYANWVDGAAALGGLLAGAAFNRFGDGQVGSRGIAGSEESPGGEPGLGLADSLLTQSLAAYQTVRMYAGGEDKRPGGGPPPPSATAVKALPEPARKSEERGARGPRKKKAACKSFDVQGWFREHLGSANSAAREAALGREGRLPYRREVLFRTCKEEVPQVCLVTQCSLDRLPRLEAQLVAWDGEVSAAVFVDAAPDSPAACAACAMILQSCACASAARSTPLPAWCITVLYRLADEDVRCPAYDCLYPVNALRNAALEAATADLVFLVDVDFLPSAGLYSRLSSARLPADMPLALVVPAFEVTSTQSGQTSSDMPTTPASLQEACMAGTAEGFHIRTFPAGHRATDFAKWLAGTGAGGLQRDSHGVDAYPVAYEEHFEPYVAVGRTTVPLYDERFRGYGLNKIAHLYELHARGFEFQVLMHHDAFVVAKAHPRSKSWELMHGLHADPAQRCRVAAHFQAFKAGLLQGTSAVDDGCSRRVPSEVQHEPLLAAAAA